MIPGNPNDRRPLSPAEILTSLEELARRFGPPAHETTEARLRRLAEDDAAERAVDAREARLLHDGQALDRVEERFVARYLGGAA